MRFKLSLYHFGERIHQKYTLLVNTLISCYSFEHPVYSAHFYRIFQLFMKTMLLICFLGLAAALPAQDSAWKTLAKITYKKEYNELMGFKVDVPVFSQDVKALEGKEVTIRGYIIPTEGYRSNTEFVFSAYPYNMCFFCGGAGPETVMEVYAKKPIAYTASPVTIKGRLHLNDDDISRLIYSLSDAEKVD